MELPLSPQQVSVVVTALNHWMAEQNMWVDAHWDNQKERDKIREKLYNVHAVHEFVEAVESRLLSDRKPDAPS